MNKTEKYSLLQIISELFFVLLPILVIFMLLTIAYRKSDIMKYTDFSFASIVLFGQTIVKFTSGAAKNNKRKKWQIISIVTSSILVFGIVPSTTVLIKIFETEVLPDFVYIIQLALFVVSILTFIILGTVGQIYLDESDT